MKYIVVQRTGFMPYFLCAWSAETKQWGEETNQWDCLRARAMTFDGPKARRIRDLLNAQRPAAINPVTVEVLR